jgi:hypothetical protein
MEEVAQDREHPRLQIRAWLEPVEMGQRLEGGFLNEIVGLIEVAAQRDREGAKVRDRPQERLARLGIERADRPGGSFLCLDVLPTWCEVVRESGVRQSFISLIDPPLGR